MVFLANTSAMQGHISNCLGCFSFLSVPLANSCEVIDLFTLVAFSCQGQAFLFYMARACNPTEFTSLHRIHLGCTALLFIGRAMSCINGRTTTCQLVLRVRLASCVDGEISLGNRNSVSLEDSMDLQIATTLSKSSRSLKSSSKTRC